MTDPTKPDAAALAAQINTLLKSAVRSGPWRDDILAKVNHLAALAQRPESAGEGEGWYCETHPESPMGHDGCGGAGILASARIHMLAHQKRLLEQEVRETAAFRDDIIRGLEARLKPAGEGAEVDEAVCKPPSRDGSMTLTLTRSQIAALSVEITHRKRSGDWMDAPLDEVKAAIWPQHSKNHDEEFDAFNESFWGRVPAKKGDAR